MRVHGQLRQTNKKWSHLKNTQKEWIINLLKQHDLDTVYGMIRERGIWIPYREVQVRSYKYKSALKSSTQV